METRADTALKARSAEVPQPARRTRPVLWWSTVGVLCTAFAAYVYGAWLSSDHARRVSPGPDPIPSSTAAWATIFQLAGPVLAAVVVAYVVRECVRRRRLCLDAMIVIGSALAWWHDPLINWLRPFVLYNATMLNLGSWTAQIPGWISPNSRYLAEPPLMIGVAYLWMPLGFGMLAGLAMRRARRRLPRLGVAGTFCAGWLAVFVVELPLEILAVRTGLVGYPAAIPGLTLWAGETHQVPVYGPVLWSMVLTATGALRFFLDPDGHSVVERGVERVPVGPRWRTVLCTFAVIGFVHVVAIVGYDLPINAAGLYAGPTEPYPSYLRTRVCGLNAPVECPGPEVPIPVGGSG